MRDRKSFLAGILSGMAPPSPFETSQLPTLGGTDASRMRGDVERVGMQFRSVMERERGEASRAQSGTQSNADPIKR